MKKLSNPTTPVADQRRLPPVRVKLLRADAYAEQTASPDGESKDWWSRLNKALGTVSTDFVRASLLQLQGAALRSITNIRSENQRLIRRQGDQNLTRANRRHVFGQRHEMIRRNSGKLSRRKLESMQVWRSRASVVTITVVRVLESR